MYSTAVSARIYKKNVEINFSKDVLIKKKAPQTVNFTKTLQEINQDTLRIIVNSLKLEVPSLIEQEVRLARISLLYLMLQYEVPIIDIAQKVLDDDSLKWCLLVIVKSSGSILKEWSYSDKVASRAITILNAARVSFSGIDLSNIRIPNADLSQGMFDDTDFTSADLSGVDLQGAWLRKINLECTIMQEVTFGERPSIYTRPKQANIICYSKNGEWLAIASKSRIFLYNAHTNIREKEIASCLTIESIVFFPNSQHLVFGGESTSISACSL
ncbi:MAG: pentapeptide repeat-containing protein [Gammaproteobacteria bacterium]